MRVRVLPGRLALLLLLLIIGGRTAAAQTGSLLGAEHVTHGAAAKPPAATPRQPVRKSGAQAAIPVVPAHGPSRPRKPLRKNQKAAAPATAAHGKSSITAAPPRVLSPETSPPPVAASGAEKKAQEPGAENPEATAATLPRFASLRSDDVNMRVGPGTRYRIEWVYKRRDLPVEIEREYDVWRWVSDPEGNHGWVHQATLMGRRGFIVQKADATLRADPKDDSAPVAVLKVGVIGRIRSCEAASDWCNVQAGSYRGYLRRQQFWGVFPGEAVAP